MKETTNQKIEKICLNLYKGLRFDENKSEDVFCHINFKNLDEKNIQQLFKNVCKQIETCKNNIDHEDKFTEDYYELEQRLKYLKTLVLKAIETKYKMTVVQDKQGEYVFTK